MSEIINGFKDLRIWKLLLSYDLGYKEESDIKNVFDDIQELQRMLHGLRKSLKYAPSA